MRSKITLTLDIVHELPLAFDAQQYADMAATEFTRLHGIRDPKLSAAAKLESSTIDTGRRPLGWCGDGEPHESHFTDSVTECPGTPGEEE